LTLRDNVVQIVAALLQHAANVKIVCYDDEAKRGSPKHVVLKKYFDILS